MTQTRQKLLFFVTVDWFFCSHFLDRALAAKKAGYDVIVMTHTDRHSERIKAMGLRVIHLPIDRRSVNPLRALVTLWQITKIYHQEQPLLIHQVALKPILLGGIAALFYGRGRIINAIVGGGYAFTSQRFIVRFVRPLLKIALRALLNPHGSKVVFENSDDLNTFVQTGMVHPCNAVLIKGAGVDPKEFRAGRLESPPVVVLVARLLWDKGIGEFVEAARILRARGLQGRFLIIGEADLGNRACIDEETLSQWQAEGVVELLGYREDIPELLSEAHIACLPSYREGLPKSLLEAMAASLPCVTTDVPGCREAVRNGDNGILVPPHDYVSLANALECLLLDNKLREHMGRRGRQRLEQEFSTEKVVTQTLALYKQLLVQ